MSKAGPSKAKTKSKRTGPPTFPPEFDLASLTKFKVPELQKRLNGGNVLFNTSANKAELQAVYVLFLLGVVAPKKKPDKELLETVTEWCKDKVSTLKDEVEERGLTCKANRWIYVQELVRDELGEAKVEEEDEEDEEPEPPKRKAKVVPKEKTTAKRKRKDAVVEESDEEEPEKPKAPVKRKRVNNDEDEKPVNKTKKIKDKGKEKEEETEEQASEEAGESSKTEAKGKEVATEDDEVQAPAKHPTPEVMNLLISTIFSDLAKAETILEEAFPNCPVENKQKVVELLNTFQAFKNQKKLSKILDKPSSDAEKLLAWIASTYGTEIIPAEGDFKIPGWANTVTQFVIAKPRLSLQKPWKKAFAEDDKKSVLLFHGTGLVNLQSILRNGFYASSDKSLGVGVFLAAEPIMSDAYASNGGRGYTYVNAKAAMARAVEFGGKWKYDPYSTSRLLFGCEATGAGRPQATGPGEFHVVTRLKSVMARYIFLLPARSEFDPLAPTRAAVGPAMTEAFEKIRAGINEDA